MNVKVYVEGGGDRRELRAKCRAGFNSFFGKTELAGRMPRIISCGGRQSTFEKFRTALTRAADSDFFVLLVDSEGPVAGGADVWTHLNARDGWGRPVGASDNSAHLMVQCMEAWFLADRDALGRFFGNGFNRNLLPHRREIENVSKHDIGRSLKAATRQCRTKGEYDKGRHSFAVLAMLSPERVTAASPHAQRLVNTLLAVAAS